MQKFRFGKKGDDDDGNRAALFGNKKNSSSSDNPYAQQQADPYAGMTSQQAAYAKYKSAPPGGTGGGLPSGPKAGYAASTYSTQSEAPPPYNNSPAGGPVGYGSANRYGAPGGYGGGNRYDNNSSPVPGGRGPGGYGGLGRNDSDDSNRDALFSGARERQQLQQQPGPTAYGGGGTGTSGAGGYGGGYGEQRELTAEEQEEAEVDDIRRQIKETKLASAQSAENSERIAAQAVETALGTYARLGAQGERLQYTNGLLDKASISTRDADDKTKKLKSLNRSMFAVHVNNPFTSNRRNAELERKITEQHESDRDMRDAARKGIFQQNAQMEQSFKEIDDARGNAKWNRSTAAERSKFRFEDDSDEDGEGGNTEDRLDDAMGRTAQHVSTLHTVAQMMGKTLDSQDKLMTTMGEKSDRVDTQARLNTERLKRIR